MARRRSAGAGIACALVAASGAAALAWQGLWTVQLSASLGHEIVAAMGVVAAIFTGLSLGSWSLGAAVNATSRPGLWYGLLEAVVGGWGLLLAFTLPSLMPWIAVTIGEQPSTAFHWLSAFLAPTLLLLPATVAMGASLPAAVRQAERGGRPWN